MRRPGRVCLLSASVLQHTFLLYSLACSHWPFAAGRHLFSSLVSTSFGWLSALSTFAVRQARNAWFCEDWRKTLREDARYRVCLRRSAVLTLGTSSRRTRANNSALVPRRRESPYCESWLMRVSSESAYVLPVRSPPSPPAPICSTSGSSPFRHEMARQSWCDVGPSP